MGGCFGGYGTETFGFSFSFYGAFLAGWGEYSIYEVACTIGLACTTSRVNSFPVKVVQRLSMGFSSLIFVCGLWKSSFEGIQVERIEFNGI